MEITSLENRKVKDWTRLHQKKYRNEEYLLLDGELILKAYYHGYLKTLIYTDECPFEFEESYQVSEEVMNKISKTEGIKYIGVGKKIRESEACGNRIMILDELADPLNIGRIMESASLFGFDTLVLSKGTADIYHEKCLKASKGAIYSLNIRRCDIREEILKLRAEGYQVYATGLRDNTYEMYDVPFAEKMAFVLGNEGSGVREEIFDVSDGVVKIDMHNIDSLNVAMAGSIIMYRFRGGQQ